MKKNKTLILTPNKTEMCGMYQLAFSMFKERIDKGEKCDIHTQSEHHSILHDIELYEVVITFLYPMHKYGKLAKEKYGKKWICYDQGIPPVDRKHFPSIVRMLYMSYFEIMNDRSKQGADEYWNVTERPQKPRWTKQGEEPIKNFEEYAIYLGRRTDYKNYDWLQKTMKELNIKLIPSDSWTDWTVYKYLSNAKMLVTASLWEGYGRPVMEAEALGIPAVSYDTGAHKKNTKKGICVPLGDEEAFKEAVLKVWRRPK